MNYRIAVTVPLLVFQHILKAITLDSSQNERILHQWHSKINKMEKLFFNESWKMRLQFWCGSQLTGKYWVKAQKLSKTFQIPGLDLITSWYSLVKKWELKKFRCWQNIRPHIHKISEQSREKKSVIYKLSECFTLHFYWWRDTMVFRNVIWPRFLQAVVGNTIVITNYVKWI